MKRVLITGADSYIGESFERFVKSRDDSYQIDTVDMVDPAWKNISFSGYDAIVHIAGIAHQKETKENAPLYYLVNRDLAIEVAKKAKCEGVRQFVFFSTMSVYGMAYGQITENTVENPVSHYGKSKFEAEVAIRKLESPDFKVAVLRPPMVYGKGCKGNYQTLRSFAKKSPIFPSIQNRRSMIFIDNLSSVIENIISTESAGLFFPQDPFYVSTTEMVRLIAEKNKSKMRFVSVFNPMLSLLAKKINLFAKVFGSLFYDQRLNVDPSWLPYQTLQETLAQTEGENQKKVLFVATVTKMHINVFHTPVLDWFQQQGWKTYVAANNDFDEDEEPLVPYADEYRVVPFSRNPFSKNNLIAYRQLKKWIDNEQFDIIHCHTPVAGMVARLAAKKARKRGTVVLYTAHGFHFFKGAPKKNWLLYYPIEKWCSRYTDVLITINQEDYELSQKMKAKRAKLVCGVGVDVRRFNVRPALTDNVAVRKDLGIPTTSFVMLSVGELNKNKNHQCAIRAMATIKDADIHYLLCGVGPGKESLSALAESLGVGSRVHFLGFRKDVPQVMTASDVFVFPSLREGLPASVMEAMAAGLPVVCSDVRGNRDLISTGENGFVCSCEDICSFAESIKKLIDHPSLRKKFGERSRDVVKQYELSAVMEQLTGIYNEVTEV